MEDAEEGFDQFGMAREDVFHKFFAGFGEADNGDAAAAARNVLQGAMEVGALEFDGRKSGGHLAGPAEAGGARHDFEDDGAAGVEAGSDVADGKRAFAVEQLEEAEFAHGDVEGGERAAELGFHPFGGVDEDGAGAEGALGSVAVGEALSHGGKLADLRVGGYSRYYGLQEFALLTQRRARLNSTLSSLFTAWLQVSSYFGPRHGTLSIASARADSR